MSRLPSLATLSCALFVAACGGETEPTGDPDTAASCLTPDYARIAPETMELGEMMPAFSWSTALHGDGRSSVLDLAGVPCNALGDIEWSPFDVLLFVSVPEW